MLGSERGGLSEYLGCHAFSCELKSSLYLGISASYVSVSSHHRNEIMLNLLSQIIFQQLIFQVMLGGGISEILKQFRWRFWWCCW